MNTILPPPRDLPPRAHARIRADLERAVGARRGRAWLVPVLAAAAVAVLVAVFAWPQAGHQENRPAAPDSTAPGKRPPPALPGLTAKQRTQLENECRRQAGVPDLEVYQVIEDAAGKFVLLYNPAGKVFECYPGDIPFAELPLPLQDVRPLDWLPGPVSIDVVETYPEGSPAAENDPHRGRAAVEMAAGRVTSDVARVTYTVNGRTGEGVLANGTYVVRILHEGRWRRPGTSRLGVVHAYDADGTELAATRLSLYHQVCHLVPGGATVPFRNAAEAPHCLGPALPWR